MTKERNITFQEREAMCIILETGRASAALLQRRMQLGYVASVKILDKLEEIGLIGIHQGIKPRKILIKVEDFVKEFSDPNQAATN